MSDAITPHPDDPGPTPPPWEETEWCDEGFSCEHPGCLADCADCIEEEDPDASWLRVGQRVEVHEMTSPDGQQGYLVIPLEEAQPTVCADNDRYPGKGWMGR